jgi:hypothetical protein
VKNGVPLLHELSFCHLHSPSAVAWRSLSVSPRSRRRGVRSRRFGVAGCPLRARTRTYQLFAVAAVDGPWCSTISVPQVSREEICDLLLLWTFSRLSKVDSRAEMLMSWQRLLTSLGLLLLHLQLGRPLPLKNDRDRGLLEGRTPRLPSLGDRPTLGGQGGHHRLPWIERTWRNMRSSMGLIRRGIFTR